MILGVRIDNYLVFSNSVELSLLADMRTKKFGCNVVKINESVNALKSTVIYGPNNSGKTCILRAIQSIKNVLLGNTADVTSNFFTNNKIVSLGISFSKNDKIYDYDFKYDSNVVNGRKNGFIYESLAEISYDKFDNKKIKNLFLRDYTNNKFIFDGDENIQNLLNIISTDNILIYLLNSVQNPVLASYRELLIEAGTNIEIIDMNNIPVQKTIEILKNNGEFKNEIVELIKEADVDIDDFKYVKNNQVNMPINNPIEIALRNQIDINDQYNLVSVHRGKDLLSMAVDSIGTKKIVALASYIVDTIKKGKTLVIDELDSSLHFKLTRAIVSLFNNDVNEKGQLIFTAHDVTLLDLKRIFRKEQIWFATKDKEREYLYSLSDFSSNETGVRNESDIIKKYGEGVFGALPDPDLISALLDK